MSVLPSAPALPPRLALLGAASVVATAAGGAIATRGGDTAASTVLTLSGLALTLLALRRELLPLPAVPPHLARPARAALLVALGALAVFTLAAAVVALTTSPRRLYSTDTALFTADNARLAAAGRDPYVEDARFRRVVSSVSTAGLTPLRRGRYAHATRAPGVMAVVRDVKRQIRSGRPLAPEYDARTLHSYPALSFLAFVPGMWLGLRTTALTSLLLLAALLLVVVAPLPPPLRAGGVLVALANVLPDVGTLHGGLEVLAFLPAVLAIRVFDRAAPSGLLLGLGCAVKQIVWPLPVLAAALALRRTGPRDALVRSAAALAGFLLPNLPYLVDAPGAWLHSQLVPVSLPMLPDGVGLVALSTAGPLPLLPSSVYAGLELLALAAAAAWCLRRPLRPELLLVISVLPFLLAWRSLSSYFSLAPLLGLYAAGPLLRRDSAAGVRS